NGPCILRLQILLNALEIEKIQQMAQSRDNASSVYSWKKTLIIDITVADCDVHTYTYVCNVDNTLTLTRSIVHIHTYVMYFTLLPMYVYIMFSYVDIIYV